MRDDRSGHEEDVKGVEKEVSEVNEPKDGSSAAYRIHRLTRSEREVLSLVAQGLRNREVANQLFVSVNTVKTHLQHIFKKLGVSNRREAAQAYHSIRNKYF